MAWRTGAGTSTRAPFSAFRRAVEVGPRSAEAHNWLGVALAEKSDLPGAIAEFEKAIELDPKYGRAYANLGSALATSGDYAEAVEVFQKALALEPNSLGAHFNLGMALRETGDLDAALLHLRKVADADPTNASIHYELGQTLRQSGDLPAAIASLEKAIEINPELREGYYALGVALRQQSALARRPRAEAASPADDVYKQARDAAGRGELAAAREQLTEALRLDEGHADAHSLLGFVLGQQRELAAGPRPPGAGGGAPARIGRGPLQPRGRALVQRLPGQGPWPSSRKSVELDPAAGGSQAFLGTALRETGDLPGARASLQRAIALLPPTAAVYVDLAIIYLRAGELDKGLGQLEAGLNLPGPWAPAPDWDSAAAGLRKALAGEPGPGRGPQRPGSPARPAGRLQQQGGRRVPRGDSAPARFRRGPQQPRSRAGPGGRRPGGHRRVPRGRADRSRTTPMPTPTSARPSPRPTPRKPSGSSRRPSPWPRPSSRPGSTWPPPTAPVPTTDGRRRSSSSERSIALAPTFARAHLALGKALLQEGNVPEAITALQEAVRLEPDRGEAHYQLGLALARAGRQAEATAALQKGRELVAADEREQTARLDVAEGRAALERGDLEQAAAKLRRAIQVRPDSAEAQAPSARSWKSRGTRRAPPLRYRKALELNPADDVGLADEGLERSGDASGPADGGPIIGRRARGREAAPQDERRPIHSGAAKTTQAGGRARRLHSPGAVRGGRAAPRRVREGAPEVLVGLVRPGLQSVRAAEDRRCHPGSRPIPRARHPRTPRPTRSWAGP